MNPSEARKLPQRSGLLVSVRNLDEARIVAPLGVDVIDLKEPSAGPLAPTSPQLWQQAGAELYGPARLSAALGESLGAIAIATEVPASFAFAKAGPSDCHSIAVLQARWSQIVERLPPAVALVAVAYADYRDAGCPGPLEIFAAAMELGISMWLVDTFTKNGRTAIDCLGNDTLEQIAHLAHHHNADWTLAGSIRLADLDRIRVTPSRFGVRGDVCAGSRQGMLVPAKVLDWTTALANRSSANYDVHTTPDRAKESTIASGEIPTCHSSN